MTPYDLAAVRAIQRGEPVDEFHRPRWSEPVRLMVDATSTPPTPPAAPAAAMSRRMAAIEDHPSLVRLTAKVA